MTKTISKTGGQRTTAGNPKIEKKSQQQPTSNATNHSQNETAANNNASANQKASIDLTKLTPEQRRLASLMNDKVDITDIEKKINKIMELTGATKDKAIVALHDCANELDKAIDMILEGDSINESEWKSQARKKKTKLGSTKESEQNTKIHLNGDAKKGQTGKSGGRQIRGKQQTAAPDKQYQQNKPFERKREQQPNWKAARETTNNDESTNNKDLDPNKLDEFVDDADAVATNNTTSNTTRETQRDRSKFNNENQFKPLKYTNRESQDRRTSTRNFNNRPFGTSGDRNLMSNQRERAGSDRRTNYPNKNYPKKPGYTNSIDTWSNLTATDPTSQSNNDYAQMTVGNWSDVVSSSTNAANATSSSATVSTVQHQQPSQKPVNSDNLNENDEWAAEQQPSANLIESNKVFSKDNQNTASIVTSNLTNKSVDDQISKMPNLASIVSGVKPTVQQNVQQHPQTQHHKSPNQKQQSINLHHSRNSEQLSNSNNHPMSSQQTSQLHKSSQQPQPQRQQTSQNPQQNKIDLAALLKPSQQPNQQTQLTNLPPDQMNKLIRGNIQQRNQQSDTNTYGAALLQRLQQMSGDTNKQTNLTDYVNQQIGNKNLVNIPSSNYNSQNAPLFDNQSHHLHHQNDQQTIDQKIIDQKSLIEKKRRQTKIPETAVEMPNSDHISSLNVQFGALDFGTDSYLNEDQIANKQQNFMNNNQDKSNPSSLLSTVRATNQQQQVNDKQQHQTKDILQNIDHHQQLQDNILHHQQDSRNKHPAGYQKSSLYSGQQQHNDNSMNSYKSNSYNQNDNTHSIYPPNLQNYGYSVNNYGSQNHNSHNSTAAGSASNNAANTSGNQSSNTSQKINLKDLDTSSTGQNNSASNINTTSSSLGGLVSNTTVTTNVLKNSLTATGKNNMQQPNVGAQQPNVAPLLGTPQYIMSQPFYPIYDMPMAADHSFRYNQNAQDVKYSRSDANDAQVAQSNHGNVQSTQAPVTQTPNHQIFSQFPPYFFYAGVNMMTQSLYQPATPFLPVQPGPTNPSAANQSAHANSNHSAGFAPSKGAQNQSYSASAYSSAGYDPSLAQLQGQDYSKQNYTSGPNNNNQGQQTGKQQQMSSAGSNDLGNSNMYTKSHALTKNFDKPGAFQTGTPPPFGIAALGYPNPNQYFQMLQPQSNPSMLHHTLQNEANQNVNSGVGGNQRGSLGQAQKNSTSNTKTYYNWS